MTEMTIPGFKCATAAKNPGLESFDKTHSAAATATKLRVLRHGPEMMPFLRGKSRHSLNPKVWLSRCCQAATAATDYVWRLPGIPGTSTLIAADARLTFRRRDRAS